MSKNRSRLNSLTASSDNQGDKEEEEEEEEEETEVEDEREDWERGPQSRKSLLFFSSRAHDSMTGERRQRRNTALTPLSPGGLLRDMQNYQ